MPPKRQSGRGTLADIGNFVRSQKLISKGLGFVPHPAAQLASQIASMVGLGKKKRRKRPQRGRGFFSDLGGGIGSVFGGLGSGVGSVAHGLFGGRKKKRRVKKMLT
jgi:hypothetical protein